MSNSMPFASTPVSEFQAHFGAPPGSPDSVADCRRWENLCGDLIAEREKLRTELATAQAEREAYAKAWLKLKCTDAILEYTNDEILACVGRDLPMRELLASLESDPES